MAAISSPWRRWSAKQYIIAALLGALVVITVSTGVSVSLAPARIRFLVANATVSRVPAGRHLSNGFYNLTLVANNTSRRTSVRYDSLSSQIWYSATGWIPAEDIDTTVALPGWRRPRDSTCFAVAADYGQYDEKGNVTKTAMTSEQLDAEKGSGDCRVVVQAKVLFRFGLFITRPYTVQATCSKVDFVNHTTHFPVQCTY